MNLVSFSSQLAHLRERADQLSREASQAPDLAPGGFPAALAEFNAALASLQASAQSLGAQVEELNRNHAAVAAERERYRALFEFAPDGYLITDRHGNIQEANWAAGILLNTAEDTLTGVPLQSFVAPEEHAAFAAELSRLDQVAGVREWETRLLPRDYAAFDASVTVGPDRDHAGAVTALRWLVRDVTARKQAAEQVRALNAELEQRVQDRTRELEAANRDLQAHVEERLRAEAALHASNEALQALIRSSPLAIVGLDCETRVQTWSPAAERLFGWRADEVIGQPPPHIPADQWATFLEQHQRELRGEACLAGEFWRVRKDGALVEVDIWSAPLRDATGAITGTMRVFTDVSERKRALAATRALARQQAAVAELGRRALSGAGLSALMQETADLVAQTLEVEYSLLLELVPDGRAFVLRAGHGWNEAAPSLFRASPETPFGYTLLANAPVIVSNLPADLRFAGPAMLEEHGVVCGISVVIAGEARAFGILGAYSTRRQTFTTDDANFLAAVANVLTAILHRSRAEAEIRALTAGLERRVAERTAELEAKNRELEAFSYSVSHDLKAPLRGIDGYSRILLEEYSSQVDEEARAFLATIRRSVLQMNDLIDDLLAYSRLERSALQPGPVDLRELIELMVAERGDEVRRRQVQVTINLPCHVVSADVEGLAQVFRNLIDNALKFTSRVAEPRLEIGGQALASHCLLWVRDNGVGFDLQYHDRIFGIFQRLHRTEDYPGTGIGLAIVQKAVRRMGGQVWAEGKPGQGACFYVQLPAPSLGAPPSPV